MKSSEELFQDLVDSAKPLIRELIDIVNEYPQGVVSVGLATLMATHAKLHGYNAISWLTVVLRAGMANWTTEETIEAVDDIQARLHEGYRELSCRAILPN